MSHATAALTPVQRLRPACKVVDDEWTLSAAAHYFHVSGRTAKRWTIRYLELGPDGMADRSSRPHASPNLRPVGIGAKLGMPASTVHAVPTRYRLDRLSPVDVKTGEPARRYERETPGH